MQLIQGSILDFKGEAIVNPANSHLRHSGGLAAVIDNAAQGGAGSPQPAADASVAQLRGWVADRNERVSEYRLDHASTPLVATGNAVTTSPGCLTQYKAIIHAVGPVWNGGHFYEDQLLMSAYRSALRVARAEGIRSIAFPAISAGVFGFPIQGVAYNAVRILDGPDARGLDVSVYLFDRFHMHAFQAAAPGSQVLA